MKGIETRVVISIQPVNPAKEGQQVSTRKQERWRFSPSFGILIFCTLLGLGMCGFVFFKLMHKDPNLDSTTVTTNEDPSTMSTATISTTTMTSAEPTTTATTTTASTLKTTTNYTFPSDATTTPSELQIYLKSLKTSKSSLKDQGSCSEKLL